MILARSYNTNTVIFMLTVYQPLHSATPSNQQHITKSNENEALCMCNRANILYSWLLLQNKTMILKFFADLLNVQAQGFMKQWVFTQITW